MEDKNILRIQMKQFGINLSIRHESKEAFEKIRKEFRLDNYDLIVVDFNGVENVTSGYAFDLFNLFRAELKDEFLKRIRVSFSEVSEATIIRSVVKGAFNASMNTNK